MGASKKVAHEEWEKEEERLRLEAQKREDYVETHPRECLDCQRDGVMCKKHEAEYEKEYFEDLKKRRDERLKTGIDWELCSECGGDGVQEKTKRCINCNKPDKYGLCLKCSNLPITPTDLMFMIEGVIIQNKLKVPKSLLGTWERIKTRVYNINSGH